MEDVKPVDGLARKIAEIVLEVSNVAKRGRNEFHKYDYVLESDVLWAIREPLAKRNIVIIPEITKSADTRDITGKSSTSTVTQVEMMLHIIDGDTGASMDLPWTGIGMDTGDKGIYKAITGGYKYFLMKLFMLASGDDPEADEKTDKVASEGRARTLKTPERIKTPAEGQAPGKADASSGRAPGAESSGCITVPESQGLWKAVRAAKVTGDTFRALLTAYGYESTKSIPSSMLTTILAIVMGGEEDTRQFIRTMPNMEMP